MILISNYTISIGFLWVFIAVPIGFQNDFYGNSEDFRNVSKTFLQDVYRNSMIEFLQDFCGISDKFSMGFVEFLQASYKISIGFLLGFLYDFYGVSKGSLWNFCGISILNSSRISIGFLQDFYVIPIGFLIGCLWDFYGITMIFLQDFYKISLGFPWKFHCGFYGIPIGLLWGHGIAMLSSYRIPMGFNWDFYSISIGILLIIPIPTFTNPQISFRFRRKIN